MNTQRFQIGDVVRVIRVAPWYRQHLGAVCTVTSELVPNPEHPDVMVHRLDLEIGPGMVAAASPESLELVYDGNQRVSWDHCVWQPRDVELPAFLRPQAQ